MKLSDSHRHLLPAMILPLLLSAGAAWAEQVTLEVAMGKPVLPTGHKQYARQTTYLKIGLTGFDLPDASKRPPINLALVVDRSCSMAGDRIEKAKEAALMVLERLSGNDIVSIVTYDSVVEVLVPATRLSDREEISRKIRGLGPRGSTALFAGVSRGLEEARKFMDKDMVTRVILLSDGQANVGPSSPNELGRLGAAAGKEGIAITTIGLGLGYNEDLMAQIAQKSDGNHAFVETAEQLSSIFQYELGDVLSVVAQEVSVKVRLAPGVRPVRVVNRDAEIHGQEVFLSLNQLYAKQERYFLLEVEIPAGESGTSRDVADVSVSYGNVVTGKTDRLAGAARVSFSASLAAVTKAENRGVMVAVVEAVAVQQNQAAVALRDEGKVEEAERVLLDNASFLKKSAVQYGSSKLDSYGKKNAADASNLGDSSWNQRRKAMRKTQHELQTQQSY